MAYSQNIVSLAEAFMKASGFHGGGQEGSLAAKVMQGLNAAEKEEYFQGLPRKDVAWAEFFSKAAIRQGHLTEAAALVPASMIDKNTVKDLAQANPQFALVVSTAQQSAEQTAQTKPPVQEYYGRMSCIKH